MVISVLFWAMWRSNSDRIPLTTKEVSTPTSVEIIRLKQKRNITLDLLSEGGYI